MGIMPSKLCIKQVCQLHAIATQAYKLGMVFPRYVWITYYVGDFNRSVDCPNVELHQYSHGVLAMDSTFITTSRNTNVSTLQQHPSYYNFMIQLYRRELIARTAIWSGS